MRDSKPDGAAILKEMVDGLEGFPEGRTLGDPTEAEAINIWRHINHCSPDNIRAIAAHVKALEAKRDAAQARVKVLENNLEGLLSEIDALIDESHGVYGLHLNGDPAPWDQLDEWLPSRDTAREALKEQP